MNNPENPHSVLSVLFAAVSSAVLALFLTPYVKDYAMSPVGAKSDSLFAYGMAYILSCVAAFCLILMIVEIVRKVTEVWCASLKPFLRKAWTSLCENWEDNALVTIILVIAGFVSKALAPDIFGFLITRLPFEPNPQAVSDDLSVIFHALTMAATAYFLPFAAIIVAGYCGMNTLKLLRKRARLSARES